MFRLGLKLSALGLLVLSLATSSGAISELRETAKALHLAAHAEHNGHTSGHDHGDSHSHRHRHGPGEPEHEHYPADPCVFASISGGAVMTSGTTSMIRFAISVQRIEILQSTALESIGLASAFRPPIFRA